MESNASNIFDFSKIDKNLLETPNSTPPVQQNIPAPEPIPQLDLDPQFNTFTSQDVEIDPEEGSSYTKDAYQLKEFEDFYIISQNFASSDAKPHLLLDFSNQKLEQLTSNIIFN